MRFACQNIRRLAAIMMLAAGFSFALNVTLNAALATRAGVNGHVAADIVSQGFTGESAYANAHPPGNHGYAVFDLGKKSVTDEPCQDDACACGCGVGSCTVSLPCAPNVSKVAMARAGIFAIMLSDLLSGSELNGLKRPPRTPGIA